MSIFRVYVTTSRESAYVSLPSDDNQSDTRKPFSAIYGIVVAFPPMSSALLAFIPLLISLWHFEPADDRERGNVISYVIMASFKYVQPGKLFLLFLT